MPFKFSMNIEVQNFQKLHENSYYSLATVGTLMVFAVLNLGELKFYLSSRKITENFYPLSLFFKNKNMFFKGDTCAL